MERLIGAKNKEEATEDGKGYELLSGALRRRGGVACDRNRTGIS
jgi:hypothetical protein